MLQHYEPRRLRLLRFIAIGLLVILFLAYLIVSIIRAVNPPIVLDNTLKSTFLIPPTLIIEGNRTAVANSQFSVQGLYQDSNGNEVVTDIANNLKAITYGNQIETSLPDALNDAFNNANTVWWLKPDPKWRMGILLSNKPWDGNTFTAIRVTVVPAANPPPILTLRLLQPEAKQAEFTDAALRPVGTAVAKTLREIRYTESQLTPLNGPATTVYDSQALDYDVPSAANNIWFQMRPGNTINEDGTFLKPIQTERLAVTWYDVLSGIGGLAGFLTTIYTLLFGASRIKTWGPVQYVMRKEIIAETAEMRAKEENKEEGSTDLEECSTDMEKGSIDMDVRMKELEEFKNRINEFYVEHGLFNDGPWYKFW